MLCGRNFNFLATLPRRPRNDRKGIDLCTDIASTSVRINARKYDSIYSLVYFPRYPFRVSNGIVIYETRVSSRDAFFLSFFVFEVCVSSAIICRHRRLPTSRRCEKLTVVASSTSVFLTISPAKERESRECVLSFAVIPRAFLSINLRVYVAILIHPCHHPFLHEALSSVHHFHNVTDPRK